MATVIKSVREAPPRRSRYPAISKPQPDNASLLQCIADLKQSVEILTKQLGPKHLNAVNFQDLVDLKLITEDQIPK
jgi:hypothetical protein